MLRLGFVCLVAAALVGLAGSAAAVWVDNMYPTGNYSPTCWDGGQDRSATFCMTDNAWVTWYAQGSVGSYGRASIDKTLYRSYAATVLTIHHPSSPVYSGGKETDIIYQHGWLQYPAIGRAWCNDSITQLGANRRCDQEYVRFTVKTDRALACHETGHAVGLTHGHDASPRRANDAPMLGCMRTPHYSAGYALGRHNKEIINRTY